MLFVYQLVVCYLSCSLLRFSLSFKTLPKHKVLPIDSCSSSISSFHVLHSYNEICLAAACHARRIIWANEKALLFQTFKEWGYVMNLKQKAANFREWGLPYMLLSHIQTSRFWSNLDRDFLYGALGFHQFSNYPISIYQRLSDNCVPVFLADW